MDMRQSEQHAAQTLARAALSWPRKSSQSRVFTAILARACLSFGPRADYVAPFALEPIKPPLGSSV